jgi:hypothetical protein
MQRERQFPERGVTEVNPAGDGRQGETVKPRQGRVVDRPNTADKRASLDMVTQTLGKINFDICLSYPANWRNVPSTV